MKSKLKIIFLFLLFSFNSFAQQSEQDKKMAWWREAASVCSYTGGLTLCGEVTIMDICHE